MYRSALTHSLCAAALLLVSMAFLGVGCTFLLPFDDDAVPDAAPADAFFGTDCDAHEPNNSIAQSVDVSLPSATVTASLCGGTDADFYQYTAPGSASVTITLTYQSGNDISVRVLDPQAAQQQQVVKNANGNEGMAILQLVGTDLEARLYHIEVYNDLTGEADYTLTVADGT